MNTPVSPGPLSHEVLTRQNEHRSTDVWNRVEYTNNPLRCRMHLRKLGIRRPSDPRVVNYIRMARFHGIYRLGSTYEIDDCLITALVERWRPETHTFHFTVGEATITLQDVAVLFGLRVDGLVVTGSADLIWRDVATDLLGVAPPPEYMRGSSVKVSWIHEQFGELPDDSNEHTIQCHARAHILLLMAGVAFCDSSGGMIQLIYLPLLRNLERAGEYSWGSATLAFLYRQLCRATEREKVEIVGPILLLQLWAWERIPIGRPRCIYYPKEGAVNDNKRAARKEARQKRGQGSQPPPFSAQFEDGQDPLAIRWLNCSYSYDGTPRTLSYYRDALDRQRDDQFVWEPYTNDVLAPLDEICRDNVEMWKTVAPLICFEIVEWHHPERVMRQFGLVQLVPGGCSYHVELHKTDRRGKHHHNWAVYHASIISLWDDRSKSIVVAPQVQSTSETMEQYMSWYMRITRVLISPLGRTPSSLYQPVAPDYHMLGHFVSEATQQGRKATQTAHQLHDKHEYNDVLGSLDGYCEYMATQGSELLGRVSFNPIYSHPSDYTSPVDTLVSPNTPPSYSGFQAPVGNPPVSSNTPPSYSGFQAPVGNPPVWSNTPPSYSGFQAPVGNPPMSSNTPLLYPEFQPLIGTHHMPSNTQLGFTFPQAAFTVFDTPPPWASSSSGSLLSPPMPGMRPYIDPCNYYGETPPRRQVPPIPSAILEDGSLSDPRSPSC